MPVGLLLRFILPVAALIALAVFVAPGAQPAAAQETATTVWTGGLTAQTTASSTYGCDNTVSGKECSGAALDKDEFTHDGTTYSITKITVSSGTLEVKFGQSIPADLKAAMALYVDDKRFYLAEGGSSATDYTWSDTGLAWTQGSSASMILSILPLETVFHHIATLKAKAQTGGSLGCAHHLDDPCHDASNMSDNTFTYGGVDRTIRWALLDTDGTFHLAVAPYQRANEVEGLTVRVGVEKTVNGVTTVEFRSFDLTSDVRGGGNFEWTSTGMSWQTGANVSLVLSSGRHFSSLTFGDPEPEVDDKTYTAGAPTPKRSLSLDEVIGLKLPMAVGGGYIHTYTATGLPAGLSMSYDLIIRGTPEAATDSPATVTYTVTDEAGNTASLTFNISVAPPVVFDAEDAVTFRGSSFEYTIGQAGLMSYTLPSASGGHGGLTYHLEYVDEGTTVLRTIDDNAPGFSFDSATRVLTSDTGGSAPSEEAVYPVKYSGVDRNGGRATLYNTVAAREAPTLSAIADQSFAIGDAVSLTLPKAEGGSLGYGSTPLEYTLEPEVDGLTFREKQRTLSGMPRFVGSTLMTYTVTDVNGVSDSETFTITVANGPAAPTSAPASVQAIQLSSQGTSGALWGAVTGATGYVVQVIEDGGSYPARPVNSTPDGVGLNFRDTDPEQVVIVGIGAGDYKVRVAARNDDGVGPWSAEAGFTVRIGGV